MLALRIFGLTKNSGIDLVVTWIPREYNTGADILSKYVGADDWEISGELFTILNAEWGPYTVDRFANGINKKLGRFYSKFFEQGSEGINAVAFCWENENNCLVPPISDVPKVIRNLRNGHVKETMVVPYWPSAGFWPLLKAGENWKKFVASVASFATGRWWLKQGSCAFSLLGSEKFENKLITREVSSEL